MEERHNCGSCLWWEEIPEISFKGKGSGTGKCRKKAPASPPLEYEHGADWPVTKKEDWCGEHFLR
jgi:hypothetical protein